MIRREIQLPGQEPQWLLISQVEHARLSGVLAEHCLSHLPEVVRTELMQAIIHHDDGWADWESAPKLDGDGCPLSFRELPLQESLSIWTNSIASAEKMGPFPAGLVSGHFMWLLKASDKRLMPPAIVWQEDMTSRGTHWWSALQKRNPRLYTRHTTRECACWLRLLDVLSLWLCSVCPTAGEQIAKSTATYHVAKGSSFETRFSFEDGRASTDPWRFNVPNLDLEADGWVVPIKEYSSADQLIAARVSCSLSWHLSS